MTRARAGATEPPATGGPPRADGSPPLPGRLRPSQLDPSSFSFVMATGIVATAARMQGASRPADVMVALAAGAWLVLAASLTTRVLRHPREVLADVGDPRRTFGHFTVVAGTDVLAACLLQLGWPRPTLVLLVMAAFAWLVLGYLVPSTILAGSPRRALSTANGSWFLWVVASESVAVVAAGLEPVVGPLQQELAVLAVLTWSIGLMLYPVTAALLALRVLDHRPDPANVDPTWWITMGALAITILAGARIVEMHSTPVVVATRPMVAGIAVMLWSFASWLVPPLVAVGVWRHLVRRVPLTYTSALWSMVFPLGMYSVAGTTLAHADRLPFIGWIARCFSWVALAAWLAVVVAMVVTSVRGNRRPGH